MELAYKWSRVSERESDVGLSVNLNLLDTGNILHKNTFPDSEEARLLASLHPLFKMAREVILFHIHSISISNQVKTPALLENLAS